MAEVQGYHAHESLVLMRKKSFPGAAILNFKKVPTTVFAFLTGKNVPPAGFRIPSTERFPKNLPKFKIKAVVFRVWVAKLYIVRAPQDAK